jgi:hypothetical protein
MPRTLVAFHLKCTAIVTPRAVHQRSAFPIRLIPGRIGPPLVPEERGERYLPVLTGLFQPPPINRDRWEYPEAFSKLDARTTGSEMFSVALKAYSVLFCFPGPKPVLAARSVDSKYSKKLISWYSQDW